MTKKTIKASDVLGENYYTYELTSSNYTPALNGSITITCTMKDVYGAVASGKSITLYQNGVSKGSQTTNSSGVATWSITCSSAGLQKFNIKDTSIEVFVDNKSDVGHTHSQYLTEHQSLTNYVTTDDSRLSDARTPTSHTHGNLQNNGQVGSTAQASKNVVTDSSGKITTEDKPTIPSASSTTPSADTTSGSYGSGTAYARSNHAHPKSSLYAEASHTHSQYLTSHQSLDSKTVTVEKLSTATSGYLSSYVVKQNGVQVGNTIDIPKDFLVKSGSVKTVSTANNPVSGYAVGDKYIDLVINAKDSSGTDEHIYILVSDLVTSSITISDVTNLQTTLDGKAPTSHATSATTYGVSSASNYGHSMASSTSPKANGTAAVGSETAKFARGDHVHPHSCVNNLTSTSTTTPLAANQGKELNTLINNAQDDIDGIYSSLNDFELVALKTDDITQLTSDTEYYPSAKGVADYVDNVLPSDLSDLNDDLGIVTTNDSRLSDARTPISHASSATTYGVGTTANYGHVKTINGLTQSSHVDGTALSAYQGKVLNDKKLEKTDITQVTDSYIQSTINFTEYVAPSVTKATVDYVNGVITTTGGNNNGASNVTFTNKSSYITIEITVSCSTNNFGYIVLDDDDMFSGEGVSQTYTIGPNESFNIWDDSSGNTINFSRKIKANSINTIANIIYPVGSFYMTINTTRPEILFGGRWQQLKDRFLLGAGDTYANESTGGSADAVVVSHTHTQAQHRHDFGGRGIYTTGGNGYAAIGDGYETSTTTYHTSYTQPNINSTGVSGTGKNMPPYLAVYMWKRVA